MTYVPMIRADSNFRTRGAKHAKELKIINWIVETSMATVAVGTRVIQERQIVEKQRARGWTMILVIATTIVVTA